jgi:flagellar biosynthesis anti-sigma factor FlgM
MKIAGNGNELNRIQGPSGIQRASEPRGPQTAGPAGAGQADQVQFSNRALELAKARTTLAQTPAVRADLVADLRARVAAGQYTVPADALAATLLKVL